MRLKNCHIENYGKFTKTDFSFEEDITQFCEMNGFGKTTLASFIRAMFYGLPTAKENAKDFNDRKRFYPSGQNPNVFFEIGYRASTGKPVIHLKRRGEKIPFDVSSIRTFDYDLTDLDVVAETRERLEKAILSFAYEDDSDEIEEMEGGEGSKIISILNAITYKLDILSQDIRKKDYENIKAVIEAYNGMQPASESMETQMLKILLPELIRNPKAADSLIKISEKFQK